MAEIKNQVTIPHPRMEVFKTIIDFENHPQWQPAIESISVMEGEPFRVGTMVTQNRHFLLRSIFVNLDVIDYQPGKLLELKGMLGTFPVRREIRVDQVGNQTQITDTFTIKPGCLFFWYTPFLTWRLKGQSATEWKNLETYLSNRGGR